eukprot:4724154-Lingulodinium_polyedra.AAC.1
MPKLNKNSNPDTTLLAQCTCTKWPGCSRRAPRTIVRAALRTLERPPNAKRLLLNGSALFRSPRWRTP